MRSRDSQRPQGVSRASHSVRRLKNHPTCLIHRGNIPGHQQEVGDEVNHRECGKNSDSRLHSVKESRDGIRPLRSITISIYACVPGFIRVHPRNLRSKIFSAGRRLTSPSCSERTVMAVSPSRFPALARRISFGSIVNSNSSGRLMITSSFTKLAAGLHTRGPRLDRMIICGSVRLPFQVI